MEALQQLVDVLVVALGEIELTGGDVEEGDARDLFLQLHRGQEVVLLLLQHAVVVGHAGGHQLDDAALDQLLGEFRVFELFADGHFQACPHQLGQIGVQGMVGEPRHGLFGGGTVVPPRQNDAQHLGRFYRVLAVGLVEVTHPEQKDRIGILRLEGVVLFH